MAEYGFVVDLKNGNGDVYEGSVDTQHHDFRRVRFFFFVRFFFNIFFAGTSEGADLTITIADGDFGALAAGELNPQSAFMMGKIKIAGNMGMFAIFSAFISQSVISFIRTFPIPISFEMSCYGSNTESYLLTSPLFFFLHQYRTGNETWAHSRCRKVNNQCVHGE